MKKDSTISKILSLIYVPKCLGCGEVLTEHSGILCYMCRTRYDMLCHRKCLAVIISHNEIVKCQARIKGRCGRRT